MYYPDLDAVDAIFGSKKKMQETETDPECNTPEFEARVEAEFKYLMNEPHALINAEIDDISKIIKQSGGNVQQIGIQVLNYYKGLAKDQSRESV